MATRYGLSKECKGLHYMGLLHLRASHVCRFPKFLEDIGHIAKTMGLIVYSEVRRLLSSMSHLDFEIRIFNNCLKARDKLKRK